MNEDDTTVILKDEDGNELLFDAIDVFFMDDQQYVILEPIRDEEQKEAEYQALLAEGVLSEEEAFEAVYEDDNLVPMRLDTVNGEDELSHLEDFEEFDRVMAAYWFMEDGSTEQ